MDDDDLEAAHGDPRLIQLLEAFREMSESDKAKFVRLSQRVAALPHEVQSAITQEEMRRMMDEDDDFRYN